jgi:hypothetical protein
MLEPRRITSIITPSSMEDLGNGNWYYNYDIQSEEVERPSFEDNESSTTETEYNYIQIKLPNRPTYKECVESIIREFITQSQEFDLINSANKSILAGDTNSDAVVKYQEYLTKVEEIKSKIKKDFE